jgi:hypothetical protein
LPDASYYFKLAPGKSKILLAYGNLLDEVADLLENDRSYQNVIQFESVLAKGLLWRLTG